MSIVILDHRQRILAICLSIHAQGRLTSERRRLRDICPGKSSGVKIPCSYFYLSIKNILIFMSLCIFSCHCEVCILGRRYSDISYNLSAGSDINSFITAQSQDQLITLASDWVELSCICIERSCMCYSFISRDNNILQSSRIWSLNSHHKPGDFVLKCKISRIIQKFRCCPTIIISCQMGR